MRETRFNIPDEHVFPINRTADGLPYVRIEDVRKKLGDGLAIRLEQSLTTSLRIAGEPVACLWELNDFLKKHVPVESTIHPKTLHV